MAYLCLFNVSLGFWLWWVLSSPPRNKGTLGWNQSTVPSLIPWLSVKVQSLHWYLVKTYRSDVYSGWGDVIYYQQLQSVDFLSRPLLLVGPLYERVIVWSMMLNIPCDSKFNQFRKKARVSFVTVMSVVFLFYLSLRPLQNVQCFSLGSFWKLIQV